MSWRQSLTHYYYYGDEWDVNTSLAQTHTITVVIGRAGTKSSDTANSKSIPVCMALVSEQLALVTAPVHLAVHQHLSTL